MMDFYFVSNEAQCSGEHEVHKECCIYLPKDKKLLGGFFCCEDAVVEASRFFQNVDACRFCSPLGRIK
ncbi:hypothetical protein [Aliikangiella sp. G2MR2-5]|uniref:hypothetical protein n=1 Tax=Aliikangiella sp. G2MR2-5 TaxID=2788943 RepID=UPI0018A88DD9|nr:hypothetical protein [Aliikangiella sp. G2MR2-5]